MWIIELKYVIKENIKMILNDCRFLVDRKGTYTMPHNYQQLTPSGRLEQM